MTLAVEEPAPTTARTRAVEFADRAPHVRAGRDLAAEQRVWLLALAPAALLGTYHAGALANAALAERGAAKASGWRGPLLEALEVGIDPHSIAACVAHGALRFLPLLAVALASGLFWQMLFARVRGRESAPGLALAALLFALALPPELPLWQAALGMSFGLVVARELFGGPARNLFHPVLAGLVFLHLSYPSAWRGAPNGLDASTWSQIVGLVPGPIGTTSALAALLGAAVLLAARAASWRPMVGVFGGAFAVSLAFSLAAPAALPMAWVPPQVQLLLGGLPFGAVFFATDPVTGACTDAGRFATGCFVGALAITVRVANPQSPDAVLFALFCGNAFAPLFDHALVARRLARKRRRIARDR